MHENFRPKGIVKNQLSMVILTLVLAAKQHLGKKFRVKGQWF